MSVALVAQSSTLRVQVFSVALFGCAELASDAYCLIGGQDAASVRYRILLSLAVSVASPTIDGLTRLKGGGMIFGFLKTYDVDCGSGFKRTVYRNIDDAFPLDIKQTKASTKAAISGIQDVAVRAEASFEQSIKGLLAGIDDTNRSMQTNFRAAYLIYKSSPCEKLEYLERAFDAIRQEEQRLRSVERIVQQLGALLSPAKSGHVLDARTLEFVGHGIERALSIVTGPTATEALSREMKVVAGLTQKWEGQ